MSIEKFVLWIMGPTSSGKTTIAENVYNELKKRTGIIHFDGDEVRDFFGDSLGFEAEDRLRVVDTIVYLANKSVNSEILHPKTKAISGILENECSNLLIDFFKQKR